MSNQRANDLDRPIGELWVELSRDEKKKICDALIDRNQPDVMQEFASLVRFTRGYLHQQPNASLSSSNGTVQKEEKVQDEEEVEDEEEFTDQDDPQDEDFTEEDEVQDEEMRR